MASRSLKKNTIGPPKTRTLTRSAVVAAALSIINEDGVETLSIRKLAARLSVSPMALYRHVDDKQDLLEAVLAQIIGEDDVCKHDEEDWRRWMAETCVRMRRSLARRPEILPILGGTDRMSVSELGTFEDILSRLIGFGLSDELAAKVFHTSVSFTFGALAFDQFKSRKLTSTKLPTRRELTASHPAVARAARHLAAPLSDADFESGLTRILKGF